MINAPVALKLDLAQCQCLGCGSSELTYRGSGAQTEAGAIICGQCDARYDMVLGLPCLVRYQEEDALSLIEILSNVGEQRARPTQDLYSTWADLLRRRHEGDDWESHLETLPPAFKAYLPTRYGQYSVFKKLSEGFNLEGAKVLDAGAGEGFDAMLLENEGAIVTAAEFNPLLAERGRDGAPNTRWFAASAHSLPFEDEAFDYVVCQAALHHMLSVPDAIREFLRVLKPGGAIFTISDSFRPDAAGVDFEWKRFDKEPVVLRGVNESVPRIGDFVSSLKPHAENLDVTLYTSRVFNHINPETKARENILEPRFWSYPEDMEALSKASGGVSMRVRKLRSISEPVRPLGKEIVAPTDFLSGVTADALGEKESAMADLAQYIPQEFCNLPFPGAAGNTKFELLNGWMLREEEEEFRKGYVRARRFLSRGPEHSTLHLELRAPETRAAELEVIVDGQSMRSAPLSSDAWTPVEFDVAHIAPNKSFSVELRLKNVASAFEDNVFHVRRFALT